MQNDTQTEYEAGIYEYEDVPSKPKRGHVSTSSTWLDQITDHQLRVGFFLIVLGTVLLVGKVLPGLDFDWWTLFLIVPGSAMLLRALNSPRNSDEWEQGFPGLMLVTIGLIFLLDLSWWFILIAAGIGFLGGWLGNDD